MSTEEPRVPKIGMPVRYAIPSPTGPMEMPALIAQVNEPDAEARAASPYRAVGPTLDLVYFDVGGGTRVYYAFKVKARPRLAGNDAYWEFP